MTELRIDLCSAKSLGSIGLIEVTGNGRFPGETHVLLRGHRRGNKTLKLRVQLGPGNERDEMQVK